MLDTRHILPEKKSIQFEVAQPPIFAADVGVPVEYASSHPALTVFGVGLRIIIDSPLQNRSINRLITGSN